MRLAIMGGTFDPIHNGHLAAASAVCAELELDKVLFMPTGNPPHKKHRPPKASAWHRHTMVTLATSDNDMFDVSSIETRHTGTSYTIDTLRSLASELSTSTELHLITGADALLDILTWKQLPALLSMCQVVAVTRPGSPSDKLQEHIHLLKTNYHASIRLVEAPALEISSSNIRAQLFLGQCARYLTPTSVLDYAHKHNLYSLPQDSKDQLLANNITTHLQTSLSKARFAHTKSVTKQAVLLAQLYGANTQKARLAGLLHDIAKQLPHEQILDLASKDSPNIDPICAQSPALLHGEAGATIAKTKFGLDTPEHADVLQAMRSHTIGHTNMGLLEQILFVADILDPLRNNEGDSAYQRSRANIRKLAHSGQLEAAVYHCLALKHDYTLSKGKALHPRAIHALEHFSKFSG